MLTMTRIKLELISHIGKELFIEKGLRERISYICRRFSEANNKYMQNNDPTNSLCILMNLYGWSQCLPYCEFRRLKKY